MPSAYLLCVSSLRPPAALRNLKNALLAFTKRVKLSDITKIDYPIDEELRKCLIFTEINVYML